MTCSRIRRACAAMLLVSVWGGALAAQEAFFDEGNRRYQEGDYAGAVELYERILESGLESGELHYNLGNAWFRLGELGPAILNRGEIWLLDLPRPDKRRPVLIPDAARAGRPPAHRYGGRSHLHPSRRPHGGGAGHCRGAQRKLVRQPVQYFHGGTAPPANLCGECWSGQDAPGVPSADHRHRVRLSGDGRTRTYLTDLGIGKSAVRQRSVTSWAVSSCQRPIWSDTRPACFGGPRRVLRSVLRQSGKTAGAAFTADRAFRSLPGCGGSFWNERYADQREVG